jgi:hypothetical protein
MTLRRSWLLLEYLLRRIGPPGWIGLAGIVVAAALFFLAAQPQWLHLQRLNAEIATTAGTLDQRRTTEATTLTLPQQLAAFYATFPKAGAVPEILGRLNGQATEQKLALETGEYALTSATAGTLDQLRITFPLRGSYPQIRKFIASALADQPALALQNLQLRRDKIGDDRVEGRLVFVLFVEHAS